MTIEFNAENQILGRIASQIAAALRGKMLTTYRPDRLPDIKVIVHNAHKVRLTGTKAQDKKYYNFSGYPGGLKTRTLPEILKRRPEDVLLFAVKRMLPANKLRDKALKLLTLETNS